MSYHLWWTRVFVLDGRTKVFAGKLCDAQPHLITVVQRGRTYFAVAGLGLMGVGESSSGALFDLQCTFERHGNGVVSKAELAAPTAGAAP